MYDIQISFTSNIKFLGVLFKYRATQSHCNQRPYHQPKPKGSKTWRPFTPHTDTRPLTQNLQEVYQKEGSEHTILSEL